LTGGIKESNAGGTSGQMIAKLGIKALIIEGQPKDKDKWYSIALNKDGATISEETDLIGKGNFAVVEALTARLGKKVGIITLGPAGEMKMLTSNISVKDPDSHIRSHGRGGTGAVMGSKNLKFITIDDTGAEGVQIADPEKFKAASKVFSKALVDHPVDQGLAAYGTNVLVNILNEAGGLPTRNFTYGQCEFHEQISGEFMSARIKERGGKPKHGCHAGCLIQCSQIYPDKNGKYLTSGFEYETVWALGANALIKELDDIAEADNIMDDLGMDSIETSVMFGVAMEAGVLPWGDGRGVIRLLKEEIGKGTPLGRILGGGTEHVGTTYGVTRVPVVKHQAIPAYDPRSVKGIGITYATSTMGADHTSGYAIATNILGVGGHVDPLKKDGQVELSRNLQIATGAVDSAGMCIFIAFPALDIPECLPALVDMINARFGIALTGDDVANLGKYVLKTEHQFNLDAGMTNKDDRLPEFFEQPVLPHNAVWDFTGEEIDAFWNF
jgi:aldehyde:ferredoxin oxidoreductase